MGRIPKPPIQRFMAFVEISGTGCWEWTGALDKDGYGVHFWTGKTWMRPHRWAYEYFVGPVPDGLILGHRASCHNRRCVNYEHLSPITPLENVLMDDTPAARNLAKTHCVNGHILAGDNLALERSGRKRVCISCRRSKDRRGYLRAVGHLANRQARC